MCHTARLQVPALPLASCTRASEGREGSFSGHLFGSICRACGLLPGWKEGSWQEGELCVSQVPTGREQGVCVHTCTALTRMRRAHTRAFIPLSCWLDSAYRVKCGCPALPGRCQPLKWVCIDLIFTSVFSEEVEVPAVPKKDGGCCSNRESMDKDSVGALFPPSAWQKIGASSAFV